MVNIVKWTAMKDCTLKQEATVSAGLFLCFAFPWVPVLPSLRRDFMRCDE